MEAIASEIALRRLSTDSGRTESSLDRVFANMCALGLIRSAYVSRVCEQGGSQGLTGLFPPVPRRGRFCSP